MKYANLIVDFERESHRMRNFGDDVQVAAIENLYEYMGVDYDNVVRIKHSELSSYNGDYVVLPINYPFFGIYAPLSPKIIPVYLGLSVLSSSVANSIRLKDSEPIGCRDAYTMDVLRKAGIQSYLNGCMTLGFPLREPTDKQDKVFFVDVSDALLKSAPQDLVRDAEFCSHLVYNRYISEEEALAVYQRYRDEARLVVTSRLHCAVPCIAYGIPVVYACEEISFRSLWLENIIPLYDSSTFHSIDWNPKPLEIESLKKLMLDNAAERVKKALEENSKMLDLSDFLESEHSPVFTLEFCQAPQRYLSERYDESSEFRYVLWGITQTAEVLYDYITREYPKSELVGVIDLYRSVEFHARESRGLELLDSIGDASLFICSESANIMATKECEKREIKDYVLCWEKLDYKLEAQL